MLRRLSAAAVAAAVAAGLAPAAGHPEAGQFVKKTFTNPDGHESPYVVFVPKGYDGTAPVPVILFLHGSGETKGGKKQPAEVGIGTAIRKRLDTFPAVVVFPQSEKRTWKADTEDGKRAIAILDAACKEYKTDPKRQYLTGLSMGGYGTWHAAFKYPDRWAAIVPICGGGDPRAAGVFKDIPCWCFHGAKDPTVKVDLSRQMVDALKKAGGNPKYTEYPDVDHYSWDPAYATDELWAWLFEQKKK